MGAAALYGTRHPTGTALCTTRRPPMAPCFAVSGCCSREPPRSCSRCYAGSALAKSSSRSCSESPETKISTFLQLFCDYGLSSVPTKRKQTVMQPITCAFSPQSAIGKLATIRNRKKIAKMSRFLFLDSRSSFGMTIWPGRTQLSIVIGFAEAPMRGNRIPHFVRCSCCSDGDTRS